MARNGVEIRLVFNDLDRLAGQARARAGQVVRKTVFDVQAGAAERSRVDTGAMKSGWQAEMTGEAEGVAYNAVAYVLVHEYGSVHIGPQPMATPAAEAARPGFEAAMRKLLD